MEKSIHDDPLVQKLSEYFDSQPVLRVFLFGSFAKGDQKDDSDIDLSIELREKYPKVEWKAIISLRHILVHDYYEIQNDIIWRIIQTHVPVFKNQILKIILEIED